MGKLGALTRLGMAAGAGYEISDIFNSFSNKQENTPIIIKEEIKDIKNTQPENQNYTYILVSSSIILFLIIFIVFIIRLLLKPSASINDTKYTTTRKRRSHVHQGNDSA